MERKETKISEQQQNQFGKMHEVERLMCDSKNSGLLNLKVSKMDSYDQVRLPLSANQM